MSSDNASLTEQEQERPAQLSGDRPTMARYTSNDIARLRNGSKVFPVTTAGNSVHRHFSIKSTSALHRIDEKTQRRRVWTCVAVFIVLFFLSLCPMGAAGQYHAYTHAYTTFSPLEVLNYIYLHIYQIAAETTHAFDAHTNQWLIDNASGYWAFEQRFYVVCITVICAVLLSVSGMLYQNVFKNPVAGPSMLGVSSGVSVGIVILVWVYGADAENLLQTRYALCYGGGVVMLLVVLGIGKLISLKTGSFNLMTMLLAGMIIGQLLGFVISYVTLFLMDTGAYLTFYNISQMLVINTEPFSWVCLGIASVVSIVPIYLLRFRMNGLAYGSLEARMLGINVGGLRVIALVCGSIMILAAQIHTGMVGLVSLVVPFIARGWFGCEFRQQFTGNVCLSVIFLLICRDIVDLIPFVGDGIAIGSVVGFVALPVFIVLMARQTRGWE